MRNDNGDPQLDIVAQRWADIDVDEAQSVLSRLRSPLHADAVVAHSGRPTAAGSLVRTSAGTVFIKRYDRTVRDAASVLPYHRFVAHLAARGIETPTFLAFDDASTALSGMGSGRSQETTLTVDNAVYEVSTRAAGDDRYREALSWDPPRTVSEAEALGSFMARLSSAARDFAEPPVRRPNPFQDHFGLFAQDDVETAMRRWLGERPAVADYLAATHRPVMSNLRAHRSYAARIASAYRLRPPCWTHGDPHVSNFLWRGSAPASVIDFGLADRNTAIFDLVETLERNTIQFVAIANGEDERCRPDLAIAILRGYHRVCDLDQADLDLIAGMLPVSQSEAALNWIAYYMTATHRPQDAAWCYDTSLLGHTAWFGRPAGRRYLDAIRGCADALSC
ncbi:phosphotransferase enzyme family protein [Bifidobacterium mongoliense]|uniref:phosphotransferase enzyme family protein n=1 Tax=Bifidobacterium mongoliense TaxID=518643 RepID=UPI00264978A6|nr:phosphotransferase [Bifidobacterium mongoliense]MDN5979374.1 phosphotransferase [Bifidobacterium mongoliense]MDN6769140.1 phosphotransferase [Bifidobacterium mongoliense]MDN6783105.1 phosphotransferase [Bifidobacterium mongoliense]